MATQRRLHPVARLLEALSGKNPLHADWHVGRHRAGSYGIGCTPAANTVVYTSDGTPVNFVFEVGGLGPFGRELKYARQMKFHGKKIPVLKLERILKSKETIRCDKDLAHIIQIRKLLRCQQSLKTKRRL